MTPSPSPLPHEYPDLLRTPLSHHVVCQGVGEARGSARCMSLRCPLPPCSQKRQLQRKNVCRVAHSLLRKGAEPLDPPGSLMEVGDGALSPSFPNAFNEPHRTENCGSKPGLFDSSGRNINCIINNYFLKGAHDCRSSAGTATMLVASHSTS